MWKKILLKSSHAKELGVESPTEQLYVKLELIWQEIAVIRISAQPRDQPATRVGEESDSQFV